MRKLLWSTVLLGLGGLLGWFLGSDLDLRQDAATRVDPSTDSSSGNTSAQSPGQRLADSRSGDIQTLLVNGRFEEVVQGYEAVRSQSRESQSDEYKHIILDHAHELIRAAQYRRAERLLKSFLVIEYNDVDALMALAEGYRRQNNYDAEIRALYDARAYAYRADEIAEIEGHIRSSVAQYTEQLSKQNDQQGLLDLYHMLTNVEPSYSAYFLQLAKIQTSLGHYQDATQSLHAIFHDPALTNEVTQLLGEIERKSSSAARTEEIIPLRRVGKHYLVNARINDVGSVTLLVDTGATVTVIEPTALQNLGIDPYDTNEVRAFNTANGVVEAPVITLASLTVGNQIVGQVHVAVMELSAAPEIDGLLGMNYLQNYRFYIDQEESVLSLSRE